jgi:hypothetical protein
MLDARFFVTTHLPSYLAICGLDPMLSAQTLGVIGGFNVVGSLFFGWAGERWNKLALLGGIYISRSLVLGWYFMLPPPPTTTLLFGAMMGFLHEPSTRQLRRCLWRRADLRRTRFLHDGLADRRRPGSGGRDHPGDICIAAADGAAAGGRAIGWPVLLPRSPDAAQRHQRVHARLRRAMSSRRGALLIRGPST